MSPEGSAGIAAGQHRQQQARRRIAADGDEVEIGRGDRIGRCPEQIQAQAMAGLETVADRPETDVVFTRLRRHSECFLAVVRVCLNDFAAPLENGTSAYDFWANGRASVGERVWHVVVN